MTSAPGERSALVAGLALGALGAVLFAGKAVIVKLGLRVDVTPETLLGLRMAYAAPFFLLVAWWCERGRPRGASTGPVPGGAPGPAPGPDGTFRWTRGDIVRTIGLGFIGYYFSSLLDFLGLQYISVGLERVILYLGPTFALLITVFWFRRPVVRLQWVALMFSYTGVLLVFVHDIGAGGGSRGDVVRGSLLVLASGLCYAVYLTGAGEMVRRIGALRLTAWASLAASFFCVAHALAAGGDAMWRAPAAVQWLSVLNAVVCTVLPIFMVMGAVARIGAARAAQTGMIGPASTIVLGATLLGEPVGMLQLVGTAIVVFGVLLLTRTPAAAEPAPRPAR